jgi:hypothetical protein
VITLVIETRLMFVAIHQKASALKIRCTSITGHFWSQETHFRGFL